MLSICDHAGNFFECGFCPHSKPHNHVWSCLNQALESREKGCYSYMGDGTKCLPIVEKELVICPVASISNNCLDCPHGKDHEKVPSCSGGCNDVKNNANFDCIPVIEQKEVICDHAGSFSECGDCPHNKPHNQLHECIDDCDESHKCLFRKEINVECSEIRKTEPTPEVNKNLEQYFVVGLTNIPEKIIFETLIDTPTCSYDPSHNPVFNGLDMNVINYCPMCGADMEFKSEKRIRSGLETNCIIKLHNSAFNNPVYFIGLSYGMLLHKSGLVDLNTISDYLSKINNQNLDYVDVIFELDPDMVEDYVCGVVYGEKIDNK